MLDRPSTCDLPSSKSPKSLFSLGSAGATSTSPRGVPLPPRSWVNRLVWVKSGGLCAFPDCRRPLVERGTGQELDAAIGEVAHIVGHAEDGAPRCEQSVPGGDRDGEPNLLLLCPTHHTMVDKQPQTYTVERLLGIKEAHERWVRERLAPEQAGDDPGPLQTETVHSTLLRVECLPMTVYTAPSAVLEPDVKPLIRAPAEPSIALPYIVRAGQLITFTPLSRSEHPFTDALSPGEVERHDATEWWHDPDRSSWYVSLLNRTLNKLTGRRGLHLDKEHHRYYFEPDRDEAGKAQPREVLYRPLNKPLTPRGVVWQPIRKKTGQARNHWIHLAVGLRFHRLTSTGWVLSVRPERRFTIDGFTPLVPKGIGRRSTRLKSHMYNYNLLGELQFWKEYLSNGEPRIILDFGGQTLIVNAELLRGEAEWPGIPGDVRPFENLRREDDLFTSAAYARALESGESLDAELERWELEDLMALEGDDALEDEP